MIYLKIAFFVLVLAVFVYFILNSKKRDKKPLPNPNILGGAETNGMEYQKIRNALHKLRDAPDLFNDVTSNRIIVKDRLRTTKSASVLGVADYPTKTIYIRLSTAKNLGLNKMVWLLLHEAAHIKFKHIATTTENETQANNYANEGLKKLRLKK